MSVYASYGARHRRSCCACHQSDPQAIDIADIGLHERAGLREGFDDPRCVGIKQDQTGKDQQDQAKSHPRPGPATPGPGFDRVVVASRHTPGAAVLRGAQGRVDFFDIRQQIAPGMGGGSGTRCGGGLDHFGFAVRLRRGRFRRRLGRGRGRRLGLHLGHHAADGGINRVFLGWLGRRLFLGLRLCFWLRFGHWLGFRLRFRFWLWRLQWHFILPFQRLGLRLPQRAFPLCLFPEHVAHIGVKLAPGRLHRVIVGCALRDQADDAADAPARLALYERKALGPLDEQARVAVRQAARRVAMFTTIAPSALLDALGALYFNLVMIRRLAEIYGGRAGFAGTWRLARRVVAHAMAAGLIAVGEDLLEPLLGGGVAGKISRRVGEGVVNGALTARLGVAAMEVCRPLPFDALDKPTLREVAWDAVRGG